jgi:hypothetical protein
MTGVEQYPVYEVTVPGQDPVRFRAYTVDDMGMDDVIVCERMLGSPFDVWSTMQGMKASLWWSATQDEAALRALADLDGHGEPGDPDGVLPPEERAWNVAGALRHTQVQIIIPDAPEGDDVPPEDARE